MKILFPFLLAILFSGFSTSAQKPDIQPLVDAWKVADTSQSHKAQVAYDALTQQKDTAHYHQVVQALYAYLEKYPDNRLEVRTIMYQVLGTLEFKYPSANCIQLMQKAIRLAHDLRDYQLIAELYSLYAELYDYKNYNYILYNYKAIELQRRIGFSHFSYVHHRFFAVSSTLYHSQEYRQSIDLGLEGLRFKKTELQHWNPKVNILQLDILGASYRKSGRYDSASYYYRQLLQTLHTESLPPGFQKIWTAIAKGNIGRIMLQQHAFTQALPYIREHLEVSREMGDTLNMALAQNALGQYYFLQKQYEKALPVWQQSYLASIAVKAHDNAMEAAEGIAHIHRVTGNKDSAFHYYEQYHHHKEALIAPFSGISLSAINAQLAFDDLQRSLIEARFTISRERNTRNLILVGAILVAVIALLLYNRYQLKEKFRKHLMQRRREVAETEVKNARVQIAAFSNDIIDKNNLIESLHKQLSFHEMNQHQKIISESLAKYTLLTNQEWEVFRAEFAKAYPAFLLKIRQLLPQISAAEERLATLIYLQFSNAQIAGSLGISKESVVRSKRRFKLRLQLPESVTIEYFLLNELIIND